jgi:hypothetical protein
MKDIKYQLINYFMVIVGFALAFVVYWYAIAHHDPSQMIIYLIVGALSILVSILIKEIVRLREQIAYLEDYVTEHVRGEK